MTRMFAGLQALGRALMLPIAVLPVAALLLRLGQPDLLGWSFVSAAGGAMFSHLGLLFAIGVATGLARDGNGAAPLAGVVAYLVTTESARALLLVPPEVVAGIPEASRAIVTTAWQTAQIDRLSVPAGILSGIVGGVSYNRFATIRLPEYLSFFGGRRFVPIVSGFVGLALGALLGASFATIDQGVGVASRWALSSGGLGLLLFGVLNRLLLVTGLHHILNNVAWFVLGDYHGVTGDMRRFFAGDPTAGAYMTGFFPVMMFGLPAACLAMYHSARADRRAAVGGMLLSLGLTSFLTGVTEPIEFAFMFLAPVLFVLHALLTGAAMAIMAALGVHLGFGFSAGLFDFVLNYPKATRPLVLLPVGLAYAALYYGIFRFAITRFDLATPGREREAVTGTTVDIADRGKAFASALGGARNLRRVDACTTRLRLIVEDQQSIDEPRLRELGALAVVRLMNQAVQVVLGPQADQIAEEIRIAMDHEPLHEAEAPVHMEESDVARVPHEIAQALGDPAALQRLRIVEDRLLLQSSGPVDEQALLAAGSRGVERVADTWHILFDPQAIAHWR